MEVLFPSGLGRGLPHGLSVFHLSVHKDLPTSPWPALESVFWGRLPHHEGWRVPVNLGSSCALIGKAPLLP